MTRKHAKLSASSSERWWNCPGSVRLAANIPESTSEFAAEGTAAHTLAEICLREGTDAWNHMDRVFNVGTYRFEVDDDMAEAVQVYLDFVRPLMAGNEWEVEAKLDLSQLFPGMFGTGDLLIFDDRTKILTVNDYKHGRGVMVDPVNNPQLLYYATGAVLRHHNRGVAKVVLNIIQPRCAVGDTRIRTWSVTPSELLDWQADLVDAAKRTEAIDAPLLPGDWCKFCPAAGMCPALRGKAFDLAQIEFSETGEMTFVQPEKLSPIQMGKLLANLDLVEDFVKRAREFAYYEATNGRAIPGFKLVWKRAQRKWLSEGDALKTLSARTKLPIDKLVKTEILTPAQMEAEIAKALGMAKTKSASLLEDLVSKQSSGTTLVAETDKREPANPSAQEDF